MQKGIDLGNGKLRNRWGSGGTWAGTKKRERKGGISKRMSGAKG